ncbi:sortase [Candidatus Gottesmanbacteria bacterium]|nr:sortase [Candidatus Gottesmanbacteria bacterium]
MQRWEVIYQYNTAIIRPIPAQTKKLTRFFRTAGLALVALSLGGMVGPLTPMIRMETGYAYQRVQTAVSSQLSAISQTNTPLPASVPVIFNPLIAEDGKPIDPINKDFSLIVPKVGINAPVLAGVNPSDPGEYMEALKKGIAHASTSFFPDEDGTVYLFSHSTNYDWFVKDLNAVFYLLKNLDTGDIMVVFYKGRRYTYKLTEKRVVAPSDISYLIPQPGSKRLILQTCWPPGSITERLLLFADLVEERYGEI